MGWVEGDVIHKQLFVIFEDFCEEQMKKGNTVAHLALRRNRKKDIDIGARMVMQEIQNDQKLQRRYQEAECYVLTEPGLPLFFFRRIEGVEEIIEIEHERRTTASVILNT